MIKQGIQLQELALRVGYSDSQLSRLANGWTEPNEKLRKAIPQVLGIPEDRAWRRI
ncbi:helix-turn-helix domain-containing protein [bacterium]|nr:helix-turn-helix domain-containing protein [bacterium]NIO20225.1 helix-turn-helix domain-containing protein [Candidatus Aenigmarchaeota archaeon]NIO73575.1 helix-turn-helix domain-containing protein [bacterium]